MTDFYFPNNDPADGVKAVPATGPGWTLAGAVPLWNYEELPAGPNVPKAWVNTAGDWVVLSPLVFPTKEAALAA